MSEGTKPTQSFEPQETAWIRAFLGGDARAFDFLVHRFKDRVFNLSYRMLGDYDEANDCAQEAFVKAYRALKDFRFEASFSTWLCTIAANTCRNRLKSLEYRTRKKMVTINPTVSSQGVQSPLEIEDPGPSALDQLTRQEQEAVIQKAIDNLTEDHKAVVILRDVEGLSYEEIAKITGYNPGTVKSKLARARHRLCELLKGVI
ncbi:MAG: RNA polymerase sigma factor [Syntrophobacteraceae bacterium]